MILSGYLLLNPTFTLLYHPKYQVTDSINILIKALLYNIFEFILLNIYVCSILHLKYPEQL